MHFILEYSANLDTERLSVPSLFAKLHQGALATGLFPLAGIRSRAHKCDDYRVADGTAAYGFVHLQVKLGAGRTEQEKAEAARHLFDILADHLKPIYDSQGLAISFEMSELPETLKFNRNNLRDYLPRT